MIRVTSFLVAGGLVALGIVWVSSLRDLLVLAVGGFRLTTSVGTAAALVVLFAILSALIAQLIWLLLTSSGALGRRLNARRKRRGNEALSRGLIAAATGDAAEACLNAVRAQTLLGDQPLSLLLSAQAARLEGNETAQTQAWRAMLARPGTVLLGLRGLFVQAMRRGDTGNAAELASRAHASKPTARWPLDALFDLKTRQRQWADARAILARARCAKLLDAVAARRCEAMLLAAEAHDAERSGDRDGALTGAFAALSLLPGLSPAAVLAARLLAQSGHVWRAQDVLAAAWTKEPNPALAQAFADIRPDESKRARARRLLALAHLNRDHFESRLLQAEQTIVLDSFAEARRLLAPFARGQSTTRVCALMAEIEQGGDHDAWAAHAWAKSAAHAQHDGDWRCARCGVASPHWQVLCTNCGAFDTLAWPAPPADALETFSGTRDLHQAIDTTSQILDRPSPHQRSRAYASRDCGVFPRKLLMSGGGLLAMPPPEEPGPGDCSFLHQSAQ